MRLIPLLTFFYTLSLALSQIIPCAKGCAGCVNVGNTCSACPDNFQLNTQGECIPSQNNFCAIYSVNSALCQSCQPTYRSQNGTCIKDMSGCLQYRGQKCLKCGFGRILVNDSCSGTLHCQRYNRTLCAGCRQGYFLSRNICYSTDINCQRIDYSNGACLRCASNFTLVGYECVFFNITVKNCYIFNSAQCIICKNGYLLRNGSCFLVPICSTSYYLSPNLSCVKLPLGCKSFDSSNFTCKECYPNFQNKNQTCEPILPPFCTILDAFGSCSKCQQNYYPFNFTCRQVSPFCGRFNNQGKCLNCKINTFVNVDGLCKDPYCLNMTEYTCLQCKDNFKFSMQLQKCILMDVNCVNITQTNCLECYNGYYVSHDICKQLPTDCLKATRQGACLQCQRDYYLQFDSCFPIKTNISNCRIYSQITNVPNCLHCQLGFFVSLGKCLQVPPFCTLLLSNGNCVSCISGYRLSANVCTPLRKGATDPNCANFNNGACNRCNGNSVLGINGICYTINNSTCVNLDQDGFCLECSNGSLTSRGVCLNISQIDVNCKTYNRNQCTECYQGYYLNNNQCKLPNANCSTFNLTDGGCLSCFFGFTLTNKQCVIVSRIANCLSYDTFGNCLQCSRMFYITNNTCFNVNPLCQNYNSFNGDCTSCFPGYALKNKNCIKQTSSVWSSITNITAVCKSRRGSQCVQCPFRYYLRQNQCILVSSSCATYNINGNCLTCSTGYFLKNGNCINYGTLSGTDPNCKLFQRESYCIQCYNGFVNVQGQCQSVDPLCKTYNSANGKCTSCYEGYSLNGGACRMQGMQQINPCIQQNNLNQCIKCIQSYYLSESKCKYNSSIKINNHNIPFCQIASNASYCILCNDGFYPRDGFCYQVSISCLTYSPTNGSCLTCKESYIFDSGSCVSPAMGFDPNCKSYQGVYCSVCISGFYLKNYICTIIDPRCINFNYDVKQCLQCRQGIPSFDVCQ